MPSDAPDIRRLAPGMRRMLLAASLLVFTIGIPLFLASDRTARFFAWTVQPPLTAAFLGAAYWASGVLEFLGSREREWARARVAVPAVLTFTAVTLIVTLLHINRFHLNFSFTDADARTTAWETLAVTWVWLVVYASVPVVMSALLIRQLREPGIDAPREARLPHIIRMGLIAQSAVLVVVGMGLLLAPAVSGPLWPWRLTPLTARAIGAWLLGIGIAAAHMASEDDWVRVRAGMISYNVFAGLELLALARYGNTQSSGPSAWV
ncbi:MAG: hypothetical protein AB7I50_24350, partial [Vicinamibacterales bacterium]